MVSVITTIDFLLLDGFELTEQVLGMLLEFQSFGVGLESFFPEHPDVVLANHLREKEEEDYA